MRVLLLSPPFQVDYMRNARCDFISLSRTQWYPIFLGHAGALLEKHGHNVLLIDAPATRLMHTRVEQMARDFRPDVLVIYGGRMSETNDQQMADGLTKSLGCRSVFCGPYVSMAPRRWLDNTQHVVAAVEGEFEHPVLEFVEQTPLDAIRNLHFRKADEIVRNEPRPYLTREQLDAIPFVSKFFLKHLDLRHYRAMSEPFPFMDIMTGRGCYWGVCSFCLWVHTYIKGPTYNSRSLDNVLKEIDFIRSRIPQVKSIMLQDDSLPEERACAISEGILDQGWNVRWSCYTRPDLPADTLRLMSEAGCLNLHVGFESGDSDVLGGSHKGIGIERMEQFVRDAKAAGLHIHGDFLMGLEGETPNSLKTTTEWATSLDVDTAQFQVVIPLEGTPLYRSLADKGWLKDGYPNYPGLSPEQLHSMARKAYRSFYLSPRQLLKLFSHPRTRLWHYLKVAHKVIPSVFWRGPRLEKSNI